MFVLVSFLFPPGLMISLFVVLVSVNYDSGLGSGWFGFGLGLVYVIISWKLFGSLPEFRVPRTIWRPLINGTPT